MAPKRRLEDIVSDGSGPQAKKGKGAASSGSDDTTVASDNPDVRRDMSSGVAPDTTPPPSPNDEHGVNDDAAAKHGHSSSSQTVRSLPGAAGSSNAHVQSEPHVGTPSVLTTKDDEDLASYKIFDIGDRDRFKRILSFHRPSDHTYSILCFPQDLVWGRVSGFKTLPSNTLHVKGTDMPVNLWHIGEITKAFFYSPQGDLYDNVSITISPLTSSGIAGSQRLLRTFSESGAIPPQEKALDEVRASCWTNTGENRGRASPFQDIYDATTRLTHKTQMSRLDASDLRTGDVVLVETTVTRYRVNTERGRSGPQRASYELCSVALLRRAPVVEKSSEGLHRLQDLDI